jgi:transcriptional antiterminator
VEPDAQLETRLSLLESSGQVDPDIVSFVRNSIPGLATTVGQPLTDATYGALITHTLLALQRARAGESITSWDSDHGDELDGFPDATAAAERFTTDAAEQLALALPAQEREFLALHLAAIQHEAA